MSEDEPWHVSRLRELVAAAPVKRKRKKNEPFVLIPLWWLEEAAKATRSPTTLVLAELWRLHWKTKRATFPLPSVRLRRLGVTRKVKARDLARLEQAGLTTVERRARKTPVITLIGV